MPMKTPWLLVVTVSRCASSALGQFRGPGGQIGPHIRTPLSSEPAPSATPTRTPSNNAQGVYIDMETHLGQGIGAEMMQDYKEAIKLLTRALEDEKDVVKL